jgi:hypothetical protein
LPASTVVSIVFVALDPQVTASTSRAIVEGMVANAPMHRIVHAVELACVLGLASLAASTGTQKSAVRGALIAYVVGCVAMVVAAVTDGFITGDVASYFLKAGHSVDTGREMMHLCDVVQDFAASSWFFQSVGVLAMALALTRERGLRRVVATLGLATGAVTRIAIVAAWPTMDGGGVIGILSAGWCGTWRPQCC